MITVLHRGWGQMITELHKQGGRGYVKMIALFMYDPCESVECGAVKNSCRDYSVNWLINDSPQLSAKPASNLLSTYRHNHNRAEVIIVSLSTFWHLVGIRTPPTLLSLITPPIAVTRSRSRALLVLWSWQCNCKLNLNFILSKCFDFISS